MTREEVLNALRMEDITFGGNARRLAEFFEALDIVIESFKKQDECDRDCKSCWKTKLVTDTNVGNKWIPCSERLPEQNGKYLVTVGEGKFPPRVFEYKNDEKLYWENEIGCKPNVDYVKAWQPLPEPYMEGET